MTRRAVRLGAGAPLLLLLGACGGGSSSSGPTTPRQQAAAMELGFAAGSMLAQVALPTSLRATSVADFARDASALRGFLQELPVSDSHATTVVETLTAAFADPDPMKGAQRLLDGMNLVKDRLAAGPHTELMNVYRLGSLVGYTVETVSFVTRGNPEPRHLQAVDGLLARYRTTLEGDLAQAGLPPDLTAATRKVGVPIRTLEDLQAAVGACLAVKDMVERLKTSR